MPTSKSIKTVSLQTLKLPVLHMSKHNITHKLIESSWTVSMKRKNKYTSVLQNIYPSHKLSPNPVHSAYMSCSHSSMVFPAKFSHIMTIPQLLDHSNKSTKQPLCEK